MPHKTLDQLPNEVAQVLHDALKWHSDRVSGRTNCADGQLELLEDSTGVLLEWLKRQGKDVRLDIVDPAEHIRAIVQRRTSPFRNGPRPKLSLVIACSKCGCNPRICGC